MNLSGPREQFGVGLGRSTYKQSAVFSEASQRGGRAAEARRASRRSRDTRVAPTPSARCARGAARTSTSMRSCVPHLAAFACMAASADAFLAPAPAPARPVHGARRMTMAASSAARTTSLRCAPRPRRAPRSPRRAGAAAVLPPAACNITTRREPAGRAHALRAHGAPAAGPVCLRGRAHARLQQDPCVSGGGGCSDGVLRVMGMVQGGEEGDGHAV